MSGYLMKIKTKIPYSEKVVDIDLDGKTLILTGGNGCGKTQLMNYLFARLKESVIERKNYNIEQLYRDLKNYESIFEGAGPADQHYDSYKRLISETKKKIESIENPSIEIKNINEFVLNYQEFKSVLVTFEAMRRSNINKPSSVISIDKLRSQDQDSTRNGEKNSSSMLEEFLVSNIANQAFSESRKINNNPEEAMRIEKWFDKLEMDLQDLFEDNSLRLVFKSDTLSFEIHQPHKDPYTFQSLSSGFSSIMAVYADLITKVSLRSIDPDELTGIVLIDEIDAHLHVSLQKKILAFLKKAFPKVQFIVSTHSPFVVSSVEDAVIYDLSRLEQVENLSMYSYEAVLEGLFGVLPISSLLQKNIEKLAALLKTSPLDIDEIQTLINILPSDDTTLDDESLYFIKSARIALSKAKRS
ncbi:AAA family ATPase [Aeromonas jandaei]|uniref:AAA family ATPase n=1 Tax=Aeromonas jandaei TaxID=650 RepID=UPI00059D687B|nr:AAA family ATPase [Aeromonas jandaei]